MPVGHVVLRNFMCPATIFMCPGELSTSPVKLVTCVYCQENKYMPRLKNHLPCRACNHKSLCALRQDLHAPGMRARLNVEPWFDLVNIMVADALAPCVPGHQQPWYWLCRIGRSLSYLRKDFNFLCHINVKEWHIKMWIYVYVPSEKFST